MIACIIAYHCTDCLLPCISRSQFHEYASWFKRGRVTGSFSLRQSELEAVADDTMQQYHWVVEKHQPWQEGLAKAILRVEV